MGYLVSIHLTTQPPDSVALRSALPASIGFAVYRHSNLSLFGIDTFKASKPPNYPFITVTPATDLPLDLGSHLHSLSETYEIARMSGSANGIKRSYINLAELLSDCLGQPVLSILSDDDGSDFACLAKAGKVFSVLATCDDNLVSFTHGETSVAPLGDERALHSNAVRLFEHFTGAEARSIGLGSWDPPMDFGFARVGT